MNSISNQDTSEDVEDKLNRLHPLKVMDKQMFLHSMSYLITLIPQIKNYRSKMLILKHLFDTIKENYEIVKGIDTLLQSIHNKMREFILTHYNKIGEWMLPLMQEWCPEKIPISIQFDMIEIDPNEKIIRQSD